MAQGNNDIPRLLPPFWPVDDQHGVGHVLLDGQPPSNPDQVVPLLVELAAQSEAMRSLQTAGGEFLSESAASALRGEMSEGLRELAELVDEESAELIRMRAKALSGAADHRETVVAIARKNIQPPLEIVCGPLCTWRMKTRAGLHSFLAATRDEENQKLLDALDDSLEGALDALRESLDTRGLEVPFKLPMNVTDLLLSAGEAAGHPKHFAYFMPEDEGVDGLPLKEQRTLYMRNVHIARYQVITIPLAEALLDGPMAAADAPIDETLMPWIRGHDHGHNLIVPETCYDDWMETLGIEPFMALQEAIADVYGFLMTISPTWLELTGVSRLDMSATHIAEMLHYLRRGPEFYGDPGAAFVELSFLAENGFVEIDEAGKISWDEDGFCRGMTALASALTEATVGAPDERGSEAFLARYGWPTETAAMRTWNRMSEELAGVPTSIAFYRPTDGGTAASATHAGQAVAS
jgi:ribosomal protein L29